MDLQKNKVYRCQITDYTADGTGFAKIEGRAVFVPRTAVGDQCDVRIVKVTKNVAFGRVEKIIDAVGAAHLRLRVRWRISAAAAVISTSPTRKNCVRRRKRCVMR